MLLFPARFSFRHVFYFTTIIAMALLCHPYAAHAQLVAPEVATSPTAIVRTPAGTLRQQQWLKASISQRMELSEQLGEEGARVFAKSKGYVAIMDGTAKGLPQGPDQVYRALDGSIHVLEAKGGLSPLGHAYGYPQGSSEWAVQAAKRMLASPAASAEQKLAAQAILQAAKDGRLYVDVVRTKYVLGEPFAAVLEQSVIGTKTAALMASEALAKLTMTSPETIEGAVRAVASGGSLALKAVGVIAIPVALVIDGGLRVRRAIAIQHEFVSGKISSEQCTVGQVKNIAGMAGGWGGAWAGAELGVVGGGAAGTAVEPGGGTVVGGFIGGSAGGVVGYLGGQAAAEKASGWAVMHAHTIANTVSNATSTAWSWTSHNCTSTWHHVFGK